VVALERLSGSFACYARDGITVFANTAFAEMVGYRRDRFAGLAFPLNGSSATRRGSGYRRAGAQEYAYTNNAP
jgi:PAS domain-containing protein